MPAKVNPEVLEMVREELIRNPSIGSQELYQRAKEMAPEIAKLSTRQFHALYPLKVRRQMAQIAGGGRRTASKDGRRRAGRRTGSRTASVAGVRIEFDENALRSALQRMMKEVADAVSQGPGNIVTVVGRIDEFANQVRETARIVAEE